MIQAPSQFSPLRPLTAKEKAVLEFLEAFLQTQGIAPSYQEIRKHFGFASLNSVQSYLKQLQNKGYIFIPGGNQKRAITLLHSSQAFKKGVNPIHSPNNQQPTTAPFFSYQHQKGALPKDIPLAESLSVPLLGRVAAGAPIEALEHNEFVDAPQSLIRNPDKSFALRVEGQSMIEDGILDGDIIFVQQQKHASNGDTIVALVESEATVKKFYLDKSQGTKVELRPANSNMQSMWFRPEQIQIQGIVVGLLRKL